MKCWHVVKIHILRPVDDLIKATSFLLCIGIITFCEGWEWRNWKIPCNLLSVLIAHIISVTLKVEIQVISTTLKSSVWKWRILNATTANFSEEENSNALNSLLLFWIVVFFRGGRSWPANGPYGLSDKTEKTPRTRWSWKNWIWTIQKKLLCWSSRTSKNVSRG